MDEKRLREFEGWASDDRKDLTLSEIVLLDAIAEACAEIRRRRDTETATRRELALCREELEKDRQAMEGADLELALGEEDAAEKARVILGKRLDAQGKLIDEAVIGKPPQLLTDP